MRPLVVLRPEPGNTATCDAARALGLSAISAPLFAMAPVAWVAPAPAACTGLLAGSANVFRHGGADLAALAALPVHAVGEATATAARNAGFAVATIGTGGLQPLVERLKAGHYLRLAGAEHVALTAPPGVTMDTRVVYAAQALPLDVDFAAPAVLALHSGEAARHLAAECVRLGLDRSRHALACLAPRIAAAAGTGWQRIEIAGAATDDALLALAVQMCQTV